MTPMKQLRYALILSASICISTFAVDAPAPAPAQDTGPWSHHLKLGAFLNNVATSNAAESNDATINSTADSASYTLSVDGRLKWNEGKHTIQNDLKMKYGRKYDEIIKWTDSTDEIDYDGVYKYNIEKVHNYYFNIGLDTVFTGPEPEEKEFDPRTGKASTGYAFKKENILPIKDAFETRLGVRAQRSWGTYTTEEQRDVQTGIEWVTRYERTQKKDLNYFVQYELFTDFDDVDHTIHLLTAGLNYKITPVFQLKLDLRAYYETEPDDVTGANTDTYDTLAFRQETLIGFTFEF